MTALRRDTPLQPGQRAMPIVWMLEHVVDPSRVPEASTETLDRACGGSGTSRRIRSWGHDANGVHWLLTRGGTGLHDDRAYRRFTHHLLLRNDGFRIRGLDDEEWHPPMTPGCLYCLDTHSPHEVVRDDRLPQTGPYKAQIAVDDEEVIQPAFVVPLIIPWLDAIMEVPLDVPLPLKAGKDRPDAP